MSKLSLQHFDAMATRLDEAGQLVEMVCAFLIRFDAPNTPESHAAKVSVARTSIPAFRPVSQWRGPVLLEAE